MFFISVYLLVLQQDSPSLTNGSRSNSIIFFFKEFICCYSSFCCYNSCPKSQTFCYGSFLKTRPCGVNNQKVIFFQKRVIISTSQKYHIFQIFVWLWLVSCFTYWWHLSINCSKQLNPQLCSTIKKIIV